MNTKAISVLCVLCIFFNLQAQQINKRVEHLDSAFISQFVYSFQIINSEISGRGADILIQQIENSQFLVLGEYHYSSQISKLTKSLVPHLKDKGYSVVAFEVGPNSANKLVELSTPFEQTKASLYQFNTKYFHPLQGDTPIPFFDGVEDAQFLSAFSEADFEIWGCDQEYYNAILFLGDELVSLMKNSSDYNKIRQNWEEARISVVHLLDKDMKKEIEVFDEIKKNKKFNEFISYFSKEDTLAQKIIQDLYTSWDIYTVRRGSHKRRIAYMRNLFLSQYKEREHRLPGSKYFLKFGALHAAKNMRSLGQYDIGALTNELATLNGTVSTNLYVMNRHYDEVDHIKEFDTFLRFGDLEEWRLIDLKALNKKLLMGELDILEEENYQSIKSVLSGYDILLISPLDRRQKVNYTK
ncbi:MAG: hypothetical protein R8N23_07920 [Reichenbachiella sp.]|uniref:hypothetical protein n=1 Tax=Reichenbachiella sp. TaxID=2184521 RepID=UPI00296614D0|nr:hypothetical protein [Reichenbachiella sp.]MDW3209778.1 hypothetical protein [Reichenbachiella sp.]